MDALTNCGHGTNTKQCLSQSLLLKKKQEKIWKTIPIFSFYGFLLKGSGGKITNDYYNILFHWSQECRTEYFNYTEPWQPDSEKKFPSLVPSWSYQVLVFFAAYLFAIGLNEKKENEEKFTWA